MSGTASVVSESLLAACRRGEEAAQHRLYKLLAYQLMGVCLRYCPNRAEAEDALQNAFVRIFTRLGQYRGEGPFEAWARRVTVHTALHAVAQNRRHTASAPLDPNDDFDPLAQLPSADPSALETLAADDLLRQLAALPPGYRTVLNLYAIEGYSHPEIAELLGISEGTSKSQLSRARQLLAQRLRLGASQFTQP
ncbi:RNA polymerase sigma factor [Hymenobacter sp. RP-2-7]|uniref:RNA polymerase sigma factor n=1 Tax=Hymenobacter polaris TaxID=2682546 RepID=A0A7Y0FML8_9BACT|nr:RNA polymerase sigma factor [Hymenobacter polaris]NML66012.1 RNA polymerase sigma factor [Hymenobacter polaris]